MDEYGYRVQIVVEVRGPDATWDEVAQKLAGRVEGLRLSGGYRVASAAVDQSSEPEGL